MLRSIPYWTLFALACWASTVASQKTHEKGASEEHSKDKAIFKHSSTSEHSSKSKQASSPKEDDNFNENIHEEDATDDNEHSEDKAPFSPKADATAEHSEDKAVFNDPSVSAKSEHSSKSEHAASPKEEGMARQHIREKDKSVSMHRSVDAKSEHSSQSEREASPGEEEGDIKMRPIDLEIRPTSYKRLRQHPEGHPRQTSDKLVSEILDSGLLAQDAEEMSVSELKELFRKPNFRENLAMVLIDFAQAAKYSIRTGEKLRESTEEVRGLLTAFYEQEYIEGMQKDARFGQHGMLPTRAWDLVLFTAFCGITGLIAMVLVTMIKSEKQRKTESEGAAEISLVDV